MQSVRMSLVLLSGFLIAHSQATAATLVEKGQAGVVAYDFRGGPPFRLPAYTWSLGRNFGLVIETRREAHDGGWHGRFVLHTQIEVIAIHDPAKPERVAA